MAVRDEVRRRDGERALSTRRRQARPDDDQVVYLVKGPMQTPLDHVPNNTPSPVFVPERRARRTQPRVFHRPLEWGATFFTLVASAFSMNVFAWSWIYGIGNAVLLAVIGGMVIAGLAENNEGVQFLVMLVGLFFGYVIVAQGVVIIPSAWDYVGFIFGLILVSLAIGGLAEAVGGRGQ